MKIFYRSIQLLGAFVLMVPLFANAAGQPTFSILGVQDIKSNKAIVSVAYDSNNASYQWETQPKISVVYTNQSTGQAITSATIGQATGSRTSLFVLRNLAPDTSYTYRAVMNYNGMTLSTGTSNFRTIPKTTTVILDGGSSTPVGSPSFALAGIQDVQQNEALISVAFDSRNAQYNWNAQPRISVTYTNVSNGNTLTSGTVGQSIGSRTTTIRLRDLEPNTRYSYKAVMYYAGQRYETNEQLFTTKKTTTTIFTATSSSATSTAVINIFPDTAVVAKTVGVSKVASNLESIVKTGGYGTKNGVSLAITDSHARVVSGDTFDYTIQYHNANNKALRTARIVVQLPDQYTFDAGDGNTVYSNSDNVVTIYLGSIAANESGSVTFKARALGGENTGVETKAMLVYTGGSVSATDRDTYVGGSQGVLGATVFGSGFFPQTFFGWLIIIIILIIIMIVARRYMTPVPAKKEEEKK
jgi:hypothetical protein